MAKKALRALEVLENIFKSGLSLILISSYIALGGLESLGWKFEKHYVDTMQTAFFIGITYNFGVEVIAIMASNFRGLKLVQDVTANATTQSITNPPITDANNINTTGTPPIYQMQGTCTGDGCLKKV